MFWRGSLELSIRAGAGWMGFPDALLKGRRRQWRTRFPAPRKLPLHCTRLVRAGAERLLGPPTRDFPCCEATGRVLSLGLMPRNVAP